MWGDCWLRVRTWGDFGGWAWQGSRWEREPRTCHTEANRMRPRWAATHLVFSLFYCVGNWSQEKERIKGRQRWARMLFTGVMEGAMVFALFHLVIIKLKEVDDLKRQPWLKSIVRSKKDIKAWTKDAARNFLYIWKIKYEIQNMYHTTDITRGSLL